jgi:DNA polymerase III epsilon subunit-like protein
MRNLDGAPIVVVDLETSGLNPFKHDVLALALVPLNIALDPCVIYVRPLEICWSEYAQTNFAKFSTEWDQKAVSPVDAYELIERYLAKTFAGQVATIVGHNVGFDVAFLKKLAFLSGRDELSGLSHRVIDTHTLLYRLAVAGRIPANAVSSTGAFEHFGINIQDELRHTALGDAVATRELFLRIIQLEQDCLVVN